MPNGTDAHDRLQREFTLLYKEQLEKYRHARILWSMVARDGYILLTNPYWQLALGYPEGRLRLRPLYAFVPESHRDRLIDVFNKAQHFRVDEFEISLGHADGYSVPCLCWMSQFLEKSTGIWVARFTAVLCD